MFNWGRKKQVVFYSMDRDADAGARHALQGSRKVKLRTVYTLDRAKVAKLMLEKDAHPRHLMHAEQILRHELGGKQTYYFVTVVSRASADYGSAENWFAQEYLPATGIEADFDHAQVSKQYALGPHKLLLLSAYAPPSVQQQVLSDFLNVKVKAFSPRHVWHSAIHWYRAGEIKAPFTLLSGLQDHDTQSRLLLETVAGMNAILQDGFAFSAKAASTPYVPAPNAILYNAHQTLPFHTSGYATRTQGLVKALIQHGRAMTVVSRAGYPGDTKIDPQGIAERLIDSVPYICDVAPGHGQWDMPLERYVDIAATHLVEQAQILKPAIIHTASNYVCGLAGVEAARRLGIPSIYEMRGLWHITKWSKDEGYAETERFALAQRLELDTARAADHVIAITGALKEWLIAHGIDGAKISLAPNPVNIETFTPLAPDRNFAAETGCADKIVIGYAGSFVQYEGLDLLVRAVAMLPAAMRATLKLLWVGDGPVLSELLGLAADLRVADIIVSLGRRPFEDVPRAYSIMDICVFPRKGVPVCEIVSPLKPFEAMAMEKAVIVSDVRPLAEIITHGVTGLIHTKDDAASLAEQLARFIGDERLRMACGRAARDWIIKTRQWDIIANDVNDVYKHLL